MDRASQIKKAMRLATQEVADLKRTGAYTTAVDGLGIPDELPGQFWRVDREGILWYRAFVKHGGLVLSPKYWILENDAVAVVGVAIEKALMQGLDSDKASTRFMYEGPGNDVVRTRVHSTDYSFLQKLFLAEITRAHQRG